MFKAQLMISDPKDRHRNAAWNLPKSYDKSIHKAYLQAIKLAENFIFIETQYLVSLIDEEHPKKSGHNKVPLALVQKIIEKFKKTKNFTYI